MSKNSDQSAIVRRPNQTNRKAATSNRRARAVESFQTAADAIGPLEHGLAVFAITRGQFSMVDAVLHVLDQTGPAFVSLWTWTIADYEVSVFNRLNHDQRITGGRLVIDHGARQKNLSLIQAWQKQFGAESVRYVLNHAKIATVQNDRFKVLIRGSMNLNFNPRFEQLDVTEGGPDFDLVREIEETLPILPNDCSGAEVFKASRVGDAFEKNTLALFEHCKTWAK